jgi:hypothetical protein
VLTAGQSVEFQSLEVLGDLEVAIDPALAVP